MGGSVQDAPVNEERCAGRLAEAASSTRLAFEEVASYRRPY